MKCGTQWYTLHRCAKGKLSISIHAADYVTADSGSETYLIKVDRILLKLTLKTKFYKHYFRISNLHRHI